MGRISKSEQVVVPKQTFGEFHKGFQFVRQAEISPAQGFRELHDAVCEAFSCTDLEEGNREDVNDLINALQNLYETVAEQENIAPDSDGFFIERQDLMALLENINQLGEAIRIHQTGLAHHDVAKAILWSKTALKKIVFKD